eukprot:sb/3477619/
MGDVLTEFFLFPTRTALVDRADVIETRITEPGWSANRLREVEWEHSVTHDPTTPPTMMLPNQDENFSLQTWHLRTRRSSTQSALEVGGVKLPCRPPLFIVEFSCQVG